MSTKVSCPRCGAPLPAAGGPCARCLLASGLESSQGEKLGTGFLDDLPLPTAPLVIADRYRVLDILGRGGMGVVYKAWQENLDRVVAVKVVSSGQHASKTEKERFLAEAKAAARLEHPGIVGIHDWGEDEGVPYFSMEYVAGKGLNQLIQDGPLPAAEAARIVKDISEAVQYAHEQGVLHRDLKPSNIMVGNDGRPRITDFGLAKRMDSPLELTLSGQTIGTPGYMPPEQVSTKRGTVGPQSDVYGLGALLYCLLTGRPPFLGSTTGETLNQVLEAEVVSPKRLNPAIPKDLETICLKCLEKATGQRYRNAGDLADDLRRFLRNEPIAARPVSGVERIVKWARRRPLVASLGAGFLLALIIGLWTTSWQWHRAETSRRLAQARGEREAAERQRAELSVAEARAALTRLEIERADGLFESGDSTQALALLARLLRQQPSNVLVAQRIINALSCRSFCLPVSTPLLHESEPPRESVSLAPLFELRRAGDILAAQFSPDGRQVVTAGKDGFARLWDADSGAPRGTALRHNKAVLWAQFSPNSARIVTASQDNTAQVWDATTCEAIGPPLLHESGVLFAQFDRKGDRIVTAAENGVVTVWEVASRAKLFSANLKPPAFYAEFTGNGELLLAASRGDRAVFIWNLETHLLVGKRTHDVHHWSALPFPQTDPSGTRYAVFGQNPCEIGYLSDTGRPPFQLLHKWHITSVAFNPDERSLATASADYSSRIWDLATGEPATGVLWHGGTVCSVAFDAFGQYLLTSCLDGIARIWSTQAGQTSSEPMRHETPIWMASFSRDRRRILTVGTGRNAWLWEARVGGTPGLAFFHNDLVNHCEFDGEGKRIATACWDGVARVWDSHDGKILAEFEAGAMGQEVHFSPRGSHLVTTTEQGVIRVWDLASGQMTAELTRDGVQEHARFDPTGVFLVTARHGNARIWNTVTGKLHATLSQSGPIRFAAFSPDGTRVLTVSADHTALLWDWQRQKPVLPPLEHDAEVTWCAFSPDGSRAVTASMDRTARIWDLHTGGQLARIEHADQLGKNSVQFSSDGHRLVTAAGPFARVWDAHNGAPISLPMRNEGPITSVRFSRDGSKVVSASEQYAGRIWDAATGHALSDPLRHEANVLGAEFSPDGKHVVTASADRTARIWEVGEVSLPIPTWLPDLAEAVAGRRVTSEEMSMTVAVEDLFRIKDRLKHLETLGYYETWAKWFLADVAKRPLTPSCPLAMPEYVRRLVEHGSEASLREALAHDPTCTKAMVKLASLLAKGVDIVHRALAEAEFLSRQALVAAPHDPEVLGCRGMVLAKLERWHEAIAPLTKAIDALEEGTNKPALNQLRLIRSEAYRVEGELERAGADCARALGILKRDPRLPRELVDLTPFFNAALDADWHNPQDKGNSLASLPVGVHSYQGTEFDVRGIAQLASTDLDAKTPGYPRRIEGIAVGQNVRSLHFLLGTGWGAQEGEVIGRIVVHYKDGQSNTVPVIYGQHVRNWQFSPNSAKWEKDGPKTAWEGTKEAWKRAWPKWGVRLYKMTWQNPRPDVEIKDLDCESTMTTSAPFLIAITTE